MALDDDLYPYLADSVSASHHVLCAPRRRLVVILLTHRVLSLISAQPQANDDTPLDTDISTTARCLAKEIVAIEDDVSVENATGAAYKSSYNSLIQTHLPELDDVGAINYDPDGKTVRPDRNLFALAVIATTSSPVAQSLFSDGLADYCRSGSFLAQASMGDY
jgi:hypothetical protein